jgi:uroporphyrinogen decarboxylase
MGSTEFLTTMMMDPDKVHTLMRTITTFLKNWLDLQRQTFQSIDGIFLLDDIIGFLGEDEFRTFGLPYFKELFDPSVSIRFLHNDAPCSTSAPFLPEMNVNFFNMGFEVTLKDLKEMTNNKVTMLGNLPPRDVLAKGDAVEIKEKTSSMLAALQDKTRIVASCGGGMPPGVTSESIRLFLKTVQG